MLKTPMNSKNNGKCFATDVLGTPPPNLSIESVSGFARELYDLRGTISRLDSERDQNFRIDTPGGASFVIKIANSAMNPAVLEMQLDALAHIAAVDPELPVPRLRKSQHGAALEQITADDGRSHLVHMLTYMPGRYPVIGADDQVLHRPMGTCQNQAC